MTIPCTKCEPLATCRRVGELVYTQSHVDSTNTNGKKRGSRSGIILARFEGVGGFGAARVDTEVGWGPTRHHSRRSMISRWRQAVSSLPLCHLCQSFDLDMFCGMWCVLVTLCAHPTPTTYTHRLFSASLCLTLRAPLSTACECSLGGRDSTLGKAIHEVGHVSGLCGVC